MKIIEPPPDFDSNNIAGFFKILHIGKTPELQSLIQKSNEEYLYWTEVRHRIPPNIDVKAEELWAYIKIARSANTKSTAIKDINEKPFTYWIPDSLHRIISEVDRCSGEIITTDQPSGLPDKERYIINSLMDEAIASSQLEGASTEYKVAKELLRSGRAPQDKHEKMIVNNWRAMQYIRENIKTKISPDKIFELHSILTDGTLKDSEDSGRLRTTDDIVVLYRDEIVHVPPKAYTLKERIFKLCELANNEDKVAWIHPIIKGAMIHFSLAYDHPFVDGNGRTARALMYWYLLNQGYTLFQYLSISTHFLKSPGQYVKAYLHTEHDDNDLTYFLVYNLCSVHFAFRELTKYIQRKQNEISKANELLHKFRGLNLRQKTFIYHTLQHPDTEYTIEAHKNSHGITYETARKDLMILATKGFLKKEKRGKKLFIFKPSEKVIEKLKSSQ